MSKAESPGFLRRKLTTREKRFGTALMTYDTQRVEPSSLSAIALLEAELANRRLVSSVKSQALALLAIKTSIISRLLKDKTKEPEALTFAKQEVTEELAKHGIPAEILEQGKKGKHKARKVPVAANPPPREDTLPEQVASSERVPSREGEPSREELADPPYEKLEIPEEFAEYLPSAEEITAFACALPESNHNKKDMGIEELDDALIKRLRGVGEIDFSAVIEGLRDERRIKERKAEYVSCLRKNALEKILNVLALTNGEFNRLYPFLDNDMGDLFVFFRLFKEEGDFHKKFQLLKKYMNIAT